MNSLRKINYKGNNLQRNDSSGNIILRGEIFIRIKKLVEEKYWRKFNREGEYSEGRKYFVLNYYGGRNTPKEMLL